MPSSPWASFQVRTPAEVTELGSTVAEGLSTVKTWLQAVRVQTRAAAALATSPADPTAAGINAAIQAAVQIAERAVEALLDEAGGYMLVVPVPKKGLVRLAPDAAPDDPGSMFFGLPLPHLVEQLPPAERARLRRLPLFAQLADPAQVLRGGNAYFLRTVGEALFDARDSSRPKFGRQDYWAYVVLVGGALDLAAVLPLAAYVDRVLGSRPRVPASRGLAGAVPPNLRAHPSGRERMAVVEWDPVTPSRVLASYDDAEVRPVEYAVVRSSDFRVATCLSVAELFGGDTLEVGQEGRFGAKVVAVERYDGVTSRWVDRSDLAADRDYYYLVGFRTRVFPADRAEPPVEVGYDRLAAAGPVRVRTRAAPTTRGQPPDWVRVPSLATIFPPVERFLDSTLERLRSIARASQTVSTVNDAYVAALEAEIVRYTDLADELRRDIDAVVKLLAMPRTAAGLAVKTGTGRGTAADFLARLIHDFSENDPNRPAFDGGDEFVTGVVLLAVGPDPASVEAQLAVFKQVFGPPEPNPLVAGIDSIGAQVAVLEAEVAAAEAAAATFGEDLAPRPVGQGDATCDPVVPATTPAFDASMRPTEE